MKGKKRKKMSEARRKALAHARRVVKSAAKTGWYDLKDGLYDSLKEMSTQKLKNVSRSSLIDSGSLTVRTGWKADLSHNIASAYKKTSKGRPMSEAHGIISKIRAIIAEGKNYTGEYRRDGKIGKGYMKVNDNAKDLEAPFEGAVARYGEEEVAKRLKKTYGSVNALEDFLEKWIWGIYDDLYGDDKPRWEQDRRKFIDCLDATVDDISGGLDYNDYGNF